MSTAKGSEEINEQGAIETRVEAVDERSPAGNDGRPKKEGVQIIHLVHKDDNSGGGGRGILAGAAAAVADAIRSTKDAISGGGKNSSKE